MSEAPFIGLRPYGQIDPDLIDSLVSFLPQVFPWPVIPLDGMGRPEFAFHKNRGQYLSKDILADLVKGAPLGSVRVLGLTDVDLFIPILTFVYGEAMLPGLAAIISLARLTEDKSGGTVPFDILVDRVIKEATHELGHTFNLTHCEDKNCVMSFAHDLGHIDRKSPLFCRYCAVLLSDALRQPPNIAPPRRRRS